VLGSELLEERAPAMNFP